MNRRIWTMLLALVMVISIVPMTAMAAECTCATLHVHGDCGYVEAVDCTCNGVGVPYHALEEGYSDCTWVVGSPCTHVCTPAEPEHQHNFNKKVIASQYAAGEGIYYYSCECGATGTQTFAQDGSTGGGEVVEHPEDEPCTNHQIIVIGDREVCFNCGYNKVIESEEPEHQHSFNKKVVAAEYAVGDGTYYYSCECGEAGTAIFALDGSTGGGDVVEHPEDEPCTNHEVIVIDNREVCFNCGYNKVIETEEPETPCAHEETVDPWGNGVLYCKECGVLVSVPDEMPEEPENPEANPCTHPNATYVEPWDMWYCDDCHSWWANETEEPVDPVDPPVEQPAATSTYGLDNVPKTGSILIEWLYALILG